MLKTMLWDPTPPELDAVTLATDDPKPIGVPEITPVDALIVTPCGRLVAENEMGLAPVTLSVNGISGWPSKPVICAAVIVGGAGLMTMVRGWLSVPPGLLALMMTL